MKRFYPYLVLLTIVALVGCAGDSSRPRSVPTVAPDAWNIAALEASSSGPFVNTVILIEATVTRNGSPAPDGTVVTFEATAGAFSSGVLEANVLTEGGSASVAYVATEAGDYPIRARVQDVSRTITVSYRDRATTDELQIFGISPRRGSYQGGEEVSITGKGILAPVEVFFDLEGSSYQAIVAAIVESDPPGEEGSVTVITPAFTGANSSVQQAADVRVIANAGTGAEDTDTLPEAFVLVPGGGPIIYGLSPASGRSSGGEVVNVLGQGFGTVASDISVSFTDDEGAVRLATVLSVAPDGSQIQVETPLFSTIPLTEDRPQDVSVATLDGGTSLEDAFIVLADNPVPNITSISPTAGPLDGGTQVTIFGNGFQVPMQVFFGSLEATDVNVFDDTTPANQDRITCISPDYSQQGATPPVAVQVTVRNSNSGNQDTFSSFTYGDPLYITGNTPAEGRAGDLVIIYGSGFEDPLQVHFPPGSGQQLEVVSVSGTELVIRIPDELGTACADTAGAFEVILLESNQRTQGGNFTIRGNSPLVTSVDPIIFQETAVGNLDPESMTINGLYFSEASQVVIGNLSVLSTNVTVESENSIDVDLAGVDVSDIVFEFNQGPCTTPLGDPGQQNVATPVDVSVVSFPGACADRLVGAIVIEPDDTTCIAAPRLSATLSNPDFGSVPVGTCSVAATLLLENVGAGTVLTVTATTLNDRFFFDSPPTAQSISWFDPTLDGPPAVDTRTAPVYFCPDAGGDTIFNGQLTVSSDDPSSPTIINLTGTGSG
jgi:hypothetical protein